MWNDTCNFKSFCWVCNSQLTQMLTSLICQKISFFHLKHQDSNHSLTNGHKISAGDYFTLKLIALSYKFIMHAYVILYNSEICNYASTIHIVQPFDILYQTPWFVFAPYRSILTLIDIDLIIHLDLFLCPLGPRHSARSWECQGSRSRPLGGECPPCVCICICIHICIFFRICICICVFCVWYSICFCVCIFLAFVFVIIVGDMV